MQQSNFKNVDIVQSNHNYSQANRCHCSTRGIFNWRDLDLLDYMEDENVSANK